MRSHTVCGPTVTYTDNIDSDQDTNEDGVQLEEMAHGVSEAPVQISDLRTRRRRSMTTRTSTRRGDQAMRCGLWWRTTMTRTLETR